MIGNSLHVPKQLVPPSGHFDRSEEVAAAFKRQTSERSGEIFIVI